MMMRDHVFMNSFMYLYIYVRLANIYAYILWKNLYRKQRSTRRFKILHHYHYKLTHIYTYSRKGAYILHIFLSCLCAVFFFTEIIAFSYTHKFSLPKNKTCIIFLNKLKSCKSFTTTKKYANK